MNIQNAIPTRKHPRPFPMADNRAAIDRLSTLTRPRRFRGPILPRQLLDLMRAIRSENRTPKS
jgi:hypothetical protein